MQAGIRLGLAALVIVAAFIAIRMGGGKTILLEDVEANSHGGALVGVTMTIRNSGPPDRLLSVEVARSKMAMLKSENVNPIPIPARSKVSLASDGAHVMIGGIPGPMEEGRLIPMVLTFENAGTVNTKARFVVPNMSGGMMDHSAMGSMEYPVPDGEPEPTLSISTTPTSEGGITVRIDTTDFTFSKDKADGPHEPGFGHGHLYVGGAKIGRVYENTAEVSTLPSGPHIVRVTLNTNDHRTYVVDDKPVTATVKVGE